MGKKQDSYNFHLIFKGLCRCVPDRKEGKLSVLLVDARSGRLSPTTGEPLRDHRAAIEFFVRDWRNPTTEVFPGLVEVNKPNKGKMGLYLLQQQDIRIGVVDGTLSPRLHFVDDESSTSFLRVPQLNDIEPGAGEVRAEAIERGDNCIARVLGLDRGEVRSERPSTFEGRPLSWAFSRPRRSDDLRDIPRLKPSDRQAFEADLETAKEINLDVRVTMQVPRDRSVLLDVNPFTRRAVDPPAFVLRPKKGRDLEVWIKNRELEVILTESDGPGREEGCPLTENVDFDFELHYELSAKAKERRIPYRPVFFSREPVTAGGCACGVCG